MLEEKQMYDNLIWVYSADNGGRGDGSNFPLRGEKRTNYEGGMRVSAFVSGGLIPQHLRGTTNSIRFHIVDWYSTFCFLANVSHTDDPPTPPLPIDPTDPNKDIYGTNSWPSVDGIVIWDFLMNPKNHNITSAHPTLVLSHEVIIQGNYKLMTSQRGHTNQSHDVFENMWQDPQGNWFAPKGWTQTCGFPVYNKTSPIKAMKPCLFDLASDMNETTDLGEAQPELLNSLWQQLNNTWLTYYHSRTPDAMLGPCNEECANSLWRQLSNGKNEGGPICDVPGCAPGPSPDPTPKRFPSINQTNCTALSAWSCDHRSPDKKTRNCECKVCNRMLSGLLFGHVFCGQCLA